MNGKKRGIGVDIGVDRLRRFPIRDITSDAQKPLVDLANKILSLIQVENYSKNSANQKQVTIYEAQIDLMVYQLYGLNEEEIKIVEENSSKK